MLAIFKGGDRDLVGLIFFPEEEELNVMVVMVVIDRRGRSVSLVGQLGRLHENCCCSSLLVRWWSPSNKLSFRVWWLIGWLINEWIGWEAVCLIDWLIDRFGSVISRYPCIILAFFSGRLEQLRRRTAVQNSTRRGGEGARVLVPCLEVERERLVAHSSHYG